MNTAEVQLRRRELQKPGGFQLRRPDRPQPSNVSSLDIPSFLTTPETTQPMLSSVCVSRTVSGNGGPPQALAIIRRTLLPDP
jgi:hypothetical protein